MKTHVKILTVVIGSLVSVSCANQNIVKTQESKADSIIKSESNCKGLVRNLTLPWQSSLESCVENRKTEKQIKNLAVIEEQKELEKRDMRIAYLAEKRKEREQDAVMYSAEVLLSEQENNVVIAIPSIEVVDSSKQVNHVSKSNNSADDRFIWFAKNIRVLGPQGRSSVSSLISEFSQSDTPILLRGYFLEDELQGYDPEVFSVARALAVKKQLVEQENVDPERITILHHTPDINARYVGVSVNG